MSPVRPGGSAPSPPSRRPRTGIWSSAGPTPTTSIMCAWPREGGPLRRHMPHTSTAAPGEVAGRWNTLSSQLLPAARSMMTTLQERVARRQPRPRRQPAQHRAHRLTDVFAGRLRHLDVDVHAPAAFGVQPFPQRQQSRRLPRLAGRVQHEVALVADKPKQLVQVEADQRRNAVVVRRHHRAGRVEETHACRPPARRRTQPGERRRRLRSPPNQPAGSLQRSTAQTPSADRPYSPGSANTTSRSFPRGSPLAGAETLAATYCRPSLPA